MVPTTETPAKRVFNVLRTDGHELEIPADTVCDQTGAGVQLVFKKAGKACGQSSGDVIAWWVEQDGLSEAYRVFELSSRRSGRRIARIPGDSIREKTEPYRKTEILLDGQITGTIYDPDQFITANWIENEDT